MIDNIFSQEALFTPTIGQNSGLTPEETINKCLKIKRISDIIDKEIGKAKSELLIKQESEIKKLGYELQKGGRAVRSPNSRTYIGGIERFHKYKKIFLYFKITVYYNPDLEELGYGVTQFVTDIYLPLKNLKNKNINFKQIVKYDGNRKSGT